MHLLPDTNVSTGLSTTKTGPLLSRDGLGQGALPTRKATAEGQLGRLTCGGDPTNKYGEVDRLMMRRLAVWAVVLGTLAVLPGSTASPAAPTPVLAQASATAGIVAAANAFVATLDDSQH